MSEVYKIIEIALFSAFIILFLGRTGLREKIRNYHDKIGAKIVADMFDCDFCLSFWTCLVIVTIAIAFTGDKTWYIAVFCSPPLTRFIL